MAGFGALRPDGSGTSLIAVVVIFERKGALGALCCCFPWPQPFFSLLASCFCFAVQTLLYRWQLLLLVPKQQPDVVFLV